MHPIVVLLQPTENYSREINYSKARHGEADDNRIRVMETWIMLELKMKAYTAKVDYCQTIPEMHHKYSRRHYCAHKNTL